MSDTEAMSESAPVRLLELVWDSCLGGKTYPERPYRMLNAALYEGLNLAITAGFEFQSEDFRTILERFNGGHWMGDVERIYSTACTGSRWSHGTYRPNVSACVSFETWQRRKPLYLFRPRDNRSERVHVGMTFRWRSGQRVTCTSIQEMGQGIVACEYKPEEPNKVKRRHRISTSEIRQFNKERRGK